MSDIEEPITATGNWLRDRLNEWWYGIDIAPLATRQAAAAEVIDAAPVVKKLPREPTMTRLELIQSVWGQGYMLPGGPEYILNLVKPFGFNPAMSVLDLTIGLGGPAKNIAEKFNIYINGMEKDHEVAEVGRAAMVKAGLSRRILISDWDPATHEMRSRSYDGIYSQHLTLSLRDKARLFGEIKKALKDNGHFTFTDFVLAEGVTAEDLRLQSWMALEPEPVIPWTAQAYIDCMEGIGLDCRIAESHKEAFIADTTLAWNNYFTRINPDTMSPDNVKLAVKEASISNKRVAMINAKLIDVYRFYAIIH